MQTTTVIEKLELLTRDLYFLSESDYPFEILDWGKKNDAEIKDKILSFHENGSPLSEFDTDVFFGRIVNNFNESGDPLLKTFAEKYSTLLDFLNRNMFKTQVFKCGKVEVGVYVVLSLKDDAVVVLKTISVET